MAGLLQIFFLVATDPTQLNQQYPDEGTQYRSEIFSTTSEQVRIAKAYIAQLDQGQRCSRTRSSRKSVRIAGSYLAEAYHQNYLTL